MIAIVRLLGLVGRLMVRPLLITSLIAVLCTVICPSARGDILFTTTISYLDDWNGAFTFGPVATEFDMPIAFSGDVWTTQGWGSAPYATEVDTFSAYSPKLHKNGAIEVGTLMSTGELEGYDGIDVKGQVTFAMTLESTQPLPPDVHTVPVIPFIFTPYEEAVVETQTYLGVTSTGVATARADIYDKQNPFMQGGSAFWAITQQGEGSQETYLPLHVKTFEGDTVVVTLNTDILLIGDAIPWCVYYPTYTVCYVFSSLGAAAEAFVDPLFEFDQPAFDSLMGNATYPLSDYYQLEFSPNIPIAPVPEPCTMLLLASGLIGLAGLWRRFKK